MIEKIDEWVLGSLSVADRARMASARKDSPELDEAVRAAESAFASMSLVSAAVVPPAGLFDRINSAIDAEHARTANLAMENASDGLWEPIAPGVELKRLWNDRTFLLRCAAGAQIHHHVHLEEEHLLILSGDLIIGSRTFVAGDYIGSPQGPDNHVHSTRGGCMLFCQMGA